MRYMICDIVRYLRYTETITGWNFKCKVGEDESCDRFAVEWVYSHVKAHHRPRFYLALKTTLRVLHDHHYLPLYPIHPLTSGPLLTSHG